MPTLGEPVVLRKIWAALVLGFTPAPQIGTERGEDPHIESNSFKAAAERTGGLMRALWITT